MKRFAFLLIACIAASSCSGDDSGSTAKKPSAIEIFRDGNSVNRSFTYDSKNRLKTLTLNNVGSTLEYDSKNRVTRIRNSDNTGFDFFYESGKLHHVIPTHEPETSLPVAYQDNERFVFDERTFETTDAGDLAFFNGLVFEYSNDKGPFAGVRHLDRVALYLIDYDAHFYASRYKINEVALGGSTYPFTHVFSNQGLFQSTTFQMVSIGYYW
ncbi:hypothetical protein [Flavobacterium selenitireducens]|uniref:hypothetical protein n=1 Tax=Flavobacterium selenitireducens TaxID=2722704 RepID=UPI00168B2A69|nr:hypothetical protein [Flavobacterium selenitireducens]MBD3582995.1 hypothetical protein [Flavobacterium selenitireducens]